ncbi:N-formylglutamate amidohydrolase [Pseudonocardia sichuanensis]
MPGGSDPTPAARRLTAGDPRSPVLLHVPHAGTEVPGWTRGHLLLDGTALDAELAALTDHRTDALATAAAGRARVRPFVLVNRVSRFVVDPERFPDEREEMAAAGMAAVYTHGTRGQRIRADDPAHRDALLAAYYRPWADAAHAAVADRLAATGRAVLLDVHSYPSRPLPYELHADRARPRVCLGTDPAHTPGWLVAAAREAFTAVGPTALDAPFAGTYVPLPHHGREPRVLSLMLEIRRDVYLTEPAGPLSPGAEDVVAALARLVDAVSAGARG